MNFFNSHKKGIEMDLYQILKDDTKSFMKNKQREKLDALRVILGEVPRLNLPAGVKPTNEQIISILKKLSKCEKIVLATSGKTFSTFLEVVESYLPKLMNKKEITAFIKNNVAYNPKEPIKAIGSIMKELKGKADGNLVKTVLLNIEDD